MGRDLRSIDEPAVPDRERKQQTNLIEAIATGVAYCAGLWGTSTLLVASFRPKDLPMPYWDRLHWLRTDTSGAAALVILTGALVMSEYLRIRRGQCRLATPSPQPRYRWHSLVVAIGRATVLLSTLLVVYISVNAVTHPITLHIHATHFLSWPTEGTLRVIALVLCGLSAGWLRCASTLNFGSVD
jgi:hypothetical protein